MSELRPLDARCSDEKILQVMSKSDKLIAAFNFSSFKLERLLKGKTKKSAFLF